MKNAHERFGVLEYTKRMKDTTTRIRLRLDRFVGEVEDGRNGKLQALPAHRGARGHQSREWKLLVLGGIVPGHLVHNQSTRQPAVLCLRASTPNCRGLADCNQQRQIPEREAPTVPP